MRIRNPADSNYLTEIPLCEGESVELTPPDQASHLITLIEEGDEPFNEVQVPFNSVQTLKEHAHEMGTLFKFDFSALDCIVL
jgi:hypothetical protein